MPPICSKLNSSDEQFIENTAVMQQYIKTFRDIEAKVREHTKAAEAKFIQRQQIIPQQRINLLLDPGAPFLELCNLCGYHMDGNQDDTSAGGSIIAGIGFVAHKRCLVVANNSAIKGGTISPAGLNKTLRLQAIALQNKLPLITLTESGGANLNYASEIFIEGARTFANQARLSAAGIPQITIVHGNATAGGAYQPGLSDYMIMVDHRAHLFLAGPPLLKAATGEITDEENLGGAHMHAHIPGTCEYLAQNDRDAIGIARRIMQTIPWRCYHEPKASWKSPRYSAAELLGIIPSNPKAPYDVREILARIADDSVFEDFKNSFDPYTICGWIEIMGHRCAIIGNNGPITPNGAAKATQFIQLCDQVSCPILFLHNTTGFLVGTEAEQQGIVKHGAKMIQAVANTTTVKISIVIGGSYGAGNYAMCGRGLDPNFIFAWPNSKTAVMGGAQAGKVLRIVTEQKQLKKGITPDPKVLDFLEQSTQKKLETESTAIYGSARLWDDGIIDPTDTRLVLAFVLDTIAEANLRPLKTNSFGIARI